VSPDALVRMVLFAETLALAVGVVALAAHAAWWWWYEHWSTGRLEAVRRSLREALAEGERHPTFTREFVRLPMRLQIYLLAELAPHLSGVEQQALRRLAMRAGLLPKAERLCRSWFWSRRLFGAKICTLVAHPAPVVRGLLADRNRSVRAQAVEWAGHAPDDGVIRQLLQMLGDRDGRCRFAAQDTLVRLGHAAIDPLIRYLACAEHDGVVGALEVALTMADARLLTPASALAQSPAPDVRARAVSLLGALGSEAGLLQIVASLDDVHANVRLAALRALAGLGHWPAAPIVARRLHDPAWDVRRQAALTLKTFGSPGLIFLRRLRDADDQMAAAVARYALDLAAAGMSS
jgi:hypothetical protein